MPNGPVLRVISGDATTEEIAAIIAAFSVLQREQEARTAATDATHPVAGDLEGWVRASRLSARRTGLMRGPWRLSGRIGRRSRA